MGLTSPSSAAPRVPPRPRLLLAAALPTISATRSGGRGLPAVTADAAVCVELAAKRSRWLGLPNALPLLVPVVAAPNPMAAPVPASKVLLPLPASVAPLSTAALLAPVPALAPKLGGAPGTAEAPAPARALELEQTLSPWKLRLAALGALTPRPLLVLHVFAVPQEGLLSRSSPRCFLLLEASASQAAKVGK